MVMRMTDMVSMNSVWLGAIWKWATTMSVSRLEKLSAAKAEPKKPARVMPT